MADNLSQKSGKSNEKTKYSNAINRTTSETMRLGEPEKVVNHPTSLISSTPTQRKKTPSFQITSVTVGSRTSNDGGDDSADDLDESHTDDMSDVIDNSRITDIENETPSYSEDTFSKEDVFFNASTTSLGTAPVIPTSSQYGLAIVASEGGSNIINAAVACANTISGGDVHVSVTDAGNVINIVGSVKPHETEMRDGHAHHAGRNERFKVVKIESTEPFKRGRWLCMDYLDHTMQQPSQQAVINVVRSNDSSDATTVGSVQYVGPPDSGVVLTDGPLTLQSMDEQIITVDPSQLKSATVGMQDQHPVIVAQHQVTMPGLTTGQNAAGPTNFPSVSPGQSLQAVQQHVSSQPHQGMPQTSIPQNMQQVVNQQQLQQQSQANQQNLQGLSQHAQSMSQVTIPQTMTAGAPSQAQTVAQHQSLPPQQIQQVMAAANLQQQQQMQQQMSQQIPQQAFVPQQAAQQAQSQPQQHLAAQPGQSQGQYYNIPSSTQAPISQAQASMQMQSHSSISAQTQTIQTSTPSQPHVPLPHHQIQQGGVSQASQQQHNIQQLQQQQYAQQMQTQPQQQQAVSQQAQTISQPAIPQQSMQQPQGMPQQPMQQPQGISQQAMQQPQGMSQQSMQQSQGMSQQPQGMSQQSMQQPQGIPQQSMQQPQGMSQQSMQQPQGMSQHSMQQPQGMSQQSMQPPQGLSQQSLQHQQGMPPQSMQQTQGMPQQPVQQQSLPQQTLQQPQGMPQQPQAMTQQGIPQQALQQSQTIPQGMQQQGIPQQTMQQPQTISQQGLSQQALQQPQGIPQQSIQQTQAMSQQSLQQPQSMPQQGIPQQSLQQPQTIPLQPLQQAQSMPQQPLQTQAMTQQGMSQSAMQQPQVVPQPQPSMSQALPQVMPQPQQAIPQVIQQSQQPIAQVMQQSQQPILQQPQPVLQTMQPPMHHSTNLQNIQQPQQQQTQQPQIHVGTVTNVAQQPQNIQQASIGQGMIPGHQMTVTSGQQGPQMVPLSSQMAPVSSVVSSVVHIPVSQASTVSSRTVQSGNVNVCLEGTLPVDQINSSDASVALLESLVEVTANAEEVQPSGAPAGEDAESASGTSAVAIDNKIEQAMDLVKSHLMFAVREEVEVLKEKIAELMDRINQLELENTILKAHATQETLAQLGGNSAQQGNKNQQTQPPPNSSVS